MNFSTNVDYTLTNEYMNILALDLGTKTGYAYNLDEKFICGTWTLATPKEINQWGKNRLVRRRDPRIGGLKWRIDMRGIDLIIFEDVLFCSTTYQCQLWASLRAVVWLTNCPRIDCVPVQTLKKFATGKGNATKSEMAKAALLAGKELPKLDDNGIDAYHLWRWAKQNYKT